MTETEKNFFFDQTIPISLTILVFAGLGLVLFLVILGLNRLPGPNIDLRLRWTDILAGLVIYFKTSVDFTLFIGRLMQSNQGWKKRVAIETGTALGNGGSTIIILSLWVIFKRLNVLLGTMTLLAALVLFELANEGLSHFENFRQAGRIKKTLYLLIEKFLGVVLKVIHPVTSKILPDLKSKLKGDRPLDWNKLFVFSLSVPFILGLDDFAGYVPLFSVVNVFGFALGVMAAHMLLNMALFLKPEATIKWVRNQWIAILGSLAFIALAVWGIVEAVRILV